jgi:catalase
LSVWNGKHRGLDTQVFANGRDLRFAGPGTPFDCDSKRGITDVPMQPLERSAVLFVVDHLKAIAALDAGRDVLAAAQLPDQADGVATGEDSQSAEVLKAFIAAVEQRRVRSCAALALTVPA